MTGITMPTIYLHCFSFWAEKM